MKKRETCIANIFVSILVVISVITAISITIFGFFGAINVGVYLNVIEIRLYPTIFSNILYLGGLLSFIYITLMIVEVLARLLLNAFNMSQSLKKNIVSYSIQIVIGSIAIKTLTDRFFTRIEVNILSVFMIVFILYIIIFFSSKAHKGIDDLEL